ncbi:hypothetical protein D7I46_09560 [Lactococcus allomyrinae]|uniref:Uncharacterized protein n=1 Tax=Lactococcus allomyrinae TaxID=2419773 RepID=A0A387BH50_9LACT|nr:hypothetical protein D7I46_09560 [Lactococcus allomyrinae]
MLSKQRCNELAQKIERGEVLTDKEYQEVFISLDERLGYNADGTSRIIEVFVNRWIAEIFGYH